MERINKILNNKNYKSYLEKIYNFEKDRIFCNHNLEHFLSMSRIAYIMILENNINISKEVVYAVGLLHDIGRWQQYDTGINHNEASVNLSVGILKDCGFTKEEEVLILRAISSHRVVSKDKVNEIFYKADKLSRNCIECNAKKECNWNNDKKNLNIKY